MVSKAHVQRTCSCWESANLINNPQASIDQKLKEAEERKKSIETERLVNYLTPAKGDIICSGSRTCRVSWPRLTSPSKRRRRARRPRFEILFFRWWRGRTCQGIWGMCFEHPLLSCSFWLSANLMNNPRIRQVLFKSWRRRKRERKASKRKGW